MNSLDYDEGKLALLYFCVNSLANILCLARKKPGFCRAWWAHFAKRSPRFLLTVDHQNTQPRTLICCACSGVRNSSGYSSSFSLRIRNPPPGRR
ncbi:hypothetical protein CSC41_2576 [Pseudomonas aeruginosa]|nr:hypothetical protein CSC41_2576 [Pseudomonas aeruginosa]